LYQKRGRGEAMATGPRSRVPFKRRKDGKTNYRRRLALVKSGKDRVVIRKSLNNILIQIVSSTFEGDKTLTTAFSKELRDMGWNFHCGNTPSAYLTGYLCGKRAKKIADEFILDIGLQRSIKGGRNYAALKGFVDAGCNVNVDESIFPPENRVKGENISSYYEGLDESLKEKNFSNYLKNKTDPSKMPGMFEEIKTKIDKL
jgi:large subunit ribosomal protein L18